MHPRRVAGRAARARQQFETAWRWPGPWRPGGARAGLGSGEGAHQTL